MRAMVQKVRDELMAARDSVCLQRALLVTEAYRRHASDPPPLRQARAFEHVLRHMDLDLASNPIFAGNTSSRPRAWMLIPEHGFAADPQVLLENEGLEGLLDGAIPEDMREFWATRSAGGSAGIGHLAVDLDRVVHHGLAATVDDARACAEEGDQAERTYRQAMLVALQVVIDWAARYADAAEKAAQEADDPILRAAHERVAKACRQVPAHPARDLFEGLQAIALVHLATAIEGHGFSVSIGLPDRVLAPFVGEGFDEKEATDLVAAFMLKIAANSIYGRGSKTQAITVGGADADGNDCSNVLTACFLEACHRLRIGDPHVFLRWHPGLDESVKRRAVEMLAGGDSMPLLVSDQATAEGFVRAGVAPEDAWDYCVIGCNELGIPGRSARSATATGGTIQHLALLNETLVGLPDPDEIEDMDGLLARLEATMRRRAVEMRRGGKAHRRRQAETVPTPFTSALMRGCVERGQDLLVGMQYELTGTYERGLVDAANALAALSEVVFERKALHLSEVVAAMRDNFGEATEAVRRKLLQAPKWGRDDERADRWARELLQMRERVLDEIDAELGDTHVVCHVVRSLHHLDGKGIGASPDGRLAGTPVADSVGAPGGSSPAGPTAMLASVLKLDAPHYFRGGYNLNLTLTPEGADAAKVRALVEGFFAAGGQELQVACLDADALREAQRHPELHGDLVVRIAGFSARFVDLSTLEQEELIGRAAGAPPLHPGRGRCPRHPCWRDPSLQTSHAAESAASSRRRLGGA